MIYQIQDKPSQIVENFSSTKAILYCRASVPCRVDVRKSLACFVEIIDLTRALVAENIARSFLMLKKSFLIPLLLAPNPSYSFVFTSSKIHVAFEPSLNLDRLGHQASATRICGHVLHSTERRSTDHSTLHHLRMVVDGRTTTAQEKPVVEPSAGVPRGPEGSIKLTYLEGNSWMCQVNGLNLLVDPVFWTLDFGVPALFRGNKRVIRDGSRALRDIVPVTDCLVLTQGLDDHCHPRTIEAMAGMLDPSVNIVAPPSAAKVLEKFFPPSRMTYVLPEESIVVSKGGRAVSLRATSGARVGPPWQQKENGYIIRPAAASPGVEAPAGGSLYLEPHLMFDQVELSGLQADVVIAPVVTQIIGGYTLVGGGTKAFDLTSALGAKKLVVMMNGELDTEGPLADMLQTEGTLDSFLEEARVRGIEAIAPTPTEALPVWS